MAGMNHKQWEYNLEALKHDGWSCCYVRFLDTKTLEFYWLADIQRNDVSYAVKAKTMQEAVNILYGFATTEAPGISNELH